MLKFFSRPVIFLLLISLLFLGLRIINLPQAINFGSDAARDFLVIWNMYTTKHPVLIGPPSEYTVNGRQFFFGPAPYYLILPALLLGKWSPLIVSYFLIFLNLAVLLISLGILFSVTKKKTIIYYFALFCTITPLMITYSQSYWNPYFMLPVSTLLVALIVKSKTRNNNALFLLTGFLFGLGLQFHYSFIFAIIISSIWLSVNKKVNLKAFALLAGGFIVGFAPIILFELRNHFYNLNTMLLVLKQPKSNTGFIFNSFYLISLLPFFFYFLSVFLVKIRSQMTLSAFFIVYTVVSLFITFSPHTYALSYPEAQQIATKIEKDHPKNFNVADQLTGDNRGTSVRYLLTVQGDEPEGVTEYPHAQTLYVYSKIPLADLLKHPVWELQSFLPYSKEKIQRISNNIYIYKLAK